VLSEGGERIAGARVWTKSGPVEVRAKMTVDATGGADLVAMAGLPSLFGDDGRVQNPIMIFRLQDVDMPRFLAARGAETILGPVVAALIRAANASGRYRLPRAKIWPFPTPRRGELLSNCTRITGADRRELNGALHRDLTEAQFEGRLQVRECARFFRESLPGCEEAFVADTGVQVGIRQTRQARGIAMLRNADILAGRKSPDGVVRSPWPIELHAGEKPRVEWLLDDWYEVPWGCLVPERGEGLVVAGRCLSAEHEAVASARVTAQCFGYGHAAGHAAAIALRDGVAPRRLSGAQLRARLDRDGEELGR
jgi:hypothetical protein